MSSTMRRASSTPARGVLEVLGDHDELVAAEPPDGVGGAQPFAEPLRDLDEQPVARVVTETVVDDLHPVEVDVEHGELGAGARRTRHGVLEPVEQERAVGEPGEGVMCGFFDERPLHLLQLGRVAHDRRAVVDPAVRAAVGDEHDAGRRAGARPGERRLAAPHALRDAGWGRPRGRAARRPDASNSSKMVRPASASARSDPLASSMPRHRAPTRLTLRSRPDGSNTATTSAAASSSVLSRSVAWRARTSSAFDVASARSSISRSRSARSYAASTERSSADHRFSSGGASVSSARRRSWRSRRRCRLISLAARSLMTMVHPCGNVATCPALCPGSAVPYLALESAG